MGRGPLCRHEDPSLGPQSHLTPVCFSVVATNLSVKSKEIPRACWLTRLVKWLSFRLDESLVSVEKVESNHGGQLTSANLGLSHSLHRRAHIHTPHLEKGFMVHSEQRGVSVD